MNSSKIIFLQRSHNNKLFSKTTRQYIPKKSKSYSIFQSKKKKIIAFYLLCLLMFGVIELLLTIFLTDMTNNIISEMISTGIILFLSLTYILTSLNKWKLIYYCLTWIIFLSFFSQIVVSQFCITTIDEKSSYIYNLFKQKIYIYAMISHSAMSLLMRYSIQWRFIHHSLIALVDIIGIIGFCFIAGKFMFESVYILFIHAFIIFIELISLNYGLSNGKSRLDFSKGIESVICQELQFGYAQCLGNNFEVIVNNDMINKRYKKLIQLKQHHNKTKSLKGKEVLSNSECKDLNMTSITPIIKNKPEPNGNSNSKNTTAIDILPNEPKQYFNAKDFYQKISYDRLNGNKAKREELRISLEDVIMKQIEICKLESKFGVFQNLGMFKYRKDSFVLNAMIHLRITKNQTKTKYFYEFIIIEIEEQKEKEKTKSNYENLLKKISHELRYPNLNIQKIVENIIKENITSKYSSISSMKDYQANILMTSSTLEQLKLIKYLSEISLLTVRDIIEHSALQKKAIEKEAEEKENETFGDNINHSNNNNNDTHNEDEGREARNKASNLDMETFIRYINELSASYLYLYNKNQEFKLNIQDIIYTTQIIIDEQKLSQIISNLITNAIKNTSEHTPIVLSINTLKKEDLTSQRKQTTQILKLPMNTSLGGGGGDQGKILSMRDSIANNSSKVKDENNDVIAGISIEIEDYGKGIDTDILHDINNEKTNIKLKNFNDYSVAKGFGAGLQICKKLCEEMNIKLKCELITKKPVKTSSKNTVNPFGILMDNPQVIGTKFILHIESEVVSKKSITKKKSLTSTCVEMKNILIEPSDKQILQYEETIEDIDSPFKNYQTNVLYRQTSINKKSRIKKQISKIFISEETAVNLHKKSLTSIPTVNSKKKATHKDINLKAMKPDKVSNNQLIQATSTLKNQQNALKPFKLNQNGYLNQANKKSNLTQIAIDSLNDSSCCSDDFTIGVMIVDDDANVTDTVRNLVNAHCRKMKIRNKITVLNDGIELIYALYTESQINNLTTKLIFCDEMMKFINGSDAFGILRKYFSSIIKDIMFISMSAFSDIVHKQKLNELGVDLIYEKPITKGQVDFIFDQLIKKNNSK